MSLLKYAAISLIGASMGASAQVRQIDKVNPEIPCYNTTEIFKELRQKYQEIPLAIGKTSDQARSTFSLWANYSTKSWTLLATKDNISCVIGVGTEFEVMQYQKGKDS